MYSKRIDASGVVAAQKAAVSTISLVGGSADSTLAVYDNASAGSGTILWELTAKAGAVESVVFPDRLFCVYGLYGVLTGTGAKAYFNLA